MFILTAHNHKRQQEQKLEKKQWRNILRANMLFLS